MSNTMLSIAAVTVLVLGSTSVMAQSPATVQHEAIITPLLSYQNALNASDVDQVINLYTQDAVFMPQNHLPAVGIEHIRQVYSDIFKLIKLNVKFTIDEVKPIGADWAYVQTRSAGTTQLLQTATLVTLSEANQEVFLMHRESNGKWRIARYIFSTTNPPKQ
ncbi:YybH family protein [Aquirhabdus sp.]|uniref:YybH family protein n=1 Tax=Aquirhabdus sp. TaxID=2824160 RepID=UPI00396C4643